MTGSSWTRLIETGRQFSEDRASDARRLTSGLVTQSQETVSNASSAVEGLMDRSRHRADTLEVLVREEVRRQLDLLDLATRDDVLALVDTLRADIGDRPSALDLATKYDLSALEYALSRLLIEVKDDLGALDLRLRTKPVTPTGMDDTRPDPDPHDRESPNPPTT